MECTVTAETVHSYIG